jgi:hypothetical protein
MTAGFKLAPLVNGGPMIRRLIPDHPLLPAAQGIDRIRTVETGLTPAEVVNRPAGAAVHHPGADEGPERERRERGGDSELRH